MIRQSINDRVFRLTGNSGAASMAMGLLVLLVMGTTGCRNCGNSCPQGYAQGYGPGGYGVGGYGAPGGFAANGSPTIPPAQTYSLNIPGRPNPGNGTRVGQLPGGLINTRQPAPTSATSPAGFNQQQGWRQNDGNNLNTQSGSAPAGDSGNRVAQSVLTNLPSSNSANPVPARTASSTSSVVPANQNLSTTVSTDYRTTSVDERRDSSRLPLTDASNVRAVSGTFANQTFGNQQPQNPTPYYQPRNSGSYASNLPQSQPFYRGDFQPPANTAYQGNFQNPVASDYSRPMATSTQVRAESTATYDPYNANAGDWRNRGRDSRAF